MIYNNNTKFVLCRYWQKLDEKGLNCASFFDETAFNKSWNEKC